MTYAVISEIIGENMGYVDNQQGLWKEIKKIGEIKKRDMGAFATVKGSGMRFDLASYEWKGIGYLSTIVTKGFLGLMRMESMIFTPLEVDVPLAAYDGMHVFGKDILMLEIYDTTFNPIDLTSMDEIKNKYNDLPNRAAVSGWEKEFMLAPCLSKEGRGIGEKSKALSDEWLSEYLRLFAKAPKCNREEKRKKIRQYTDKLFTQGGVAVNQFKKMLGEDKATELLDQYIFSSGAP